MLRGIYTRMPYEPEIDLFDLGNPLVPVQARHHEMADEIRSLTDELGEAFLELQALRLPADCNATARAVATLVSIGNGRFVQDIFEALQTLSFDMNLRRDTDLKWGLALKITATLNKHNYNQTHLTGEVKQVIPPISSEGVVYVDTDGNIITPSEAVKQLSMFQYGISIKPEPVHA